MNSRNGEGQALLIKSVIERGICVRCGACVGLCPYFDYFDGKVVVLDRCQAETWRCLQVCPRADANPEARDLLSGAGDSNDPLGPCTNILMARTKDEETRSKAQYGGVVSTVVRLAFTQGFVASAVLADTGDHLAPAGKLVRRSTEVLTCAGSRYTPSGGLATVNKALKAGELKIGVVGLPCQMEALSRLQLMKPDGAELYSRISLRIGLFCTWALDYRQFNAFLKKEGVNDAVKKYDIPPPPAEKLVIQSELGVKEFPLSAIRPLVQKGCALCQDMTAQRADISVGAAEGFEEWNTVLVRTELGTQLLQSAAEAGLVETRELPGANFRHLREASGNKWQRGRQAKVELDRRDA